MTASYKLIHYSPDPFSGARFVLGAVVVAESGRVAATAVEKLPSADCLGGRSLAIAVQRLHARVARIESA